jgi:hypothetical protein
MINVCFSLIILAFFPYEEYTKSSNFSPPRKTPLIPAKKSSSIKKNPPIDTLFYDDGIAFDAWAWNSAQNGWGVKFTPPSQSHLRGILIYFWDESWPQPGGDFASFRLYSDSLGYPGEILLELDSIQIQRGNWNYIDISPYNLVVDGDFYVFYIQTSDYPHCPGLAIDEISDAPLGTQWALYSGYFFSDDPRPGDWMIRAVVEWVPLYLDVGVISILNPSGEYLEPGSTVPIEFVVFNFGTTAVNIPVFAEISGADYRDSTIVPYLSTGDSVVVQAENWNVPEEEGDFNLTVFTILPGDERPENDTQFLYLRNYHKKGDLLSVIDVGGITGDDECYGVEFDGEYFYITGGNSGFDPNRVYVVDNNSLLVCIMEQPPYLMDMGWRDITFEPIQTGIPTDSLYATYSTNLYVWGIGEGCILNLWRMVPCPYAIDRALAFNLQNQHFYSAGFGGYMYEFDKDCNLYNQWVNTRAISGITVEYEDTLFFVWFSAQELNSYGFFNKLYKFDPVSGEVVDSIEFPLPDGWSSGIAGGLTFCPNYGLKRVLMELVQGEPTDFIAIIYLSETVLPCGDMNGDITVNSADLSYLANYLFFSGPSPLDLSKADVNGDMQLNMADLSYLANFLYFAGPDLNCPE